MDKRGLTLIELLIVIAIIGILAMIAVPAYIGQQRNAARTEAFSNLQNLRLLEEQFFAENARYTVSLGTVGKDNPGNVGTIQTGGGDSSNALPGFRPGTGQNYSYWIIQNQQITSASSNPPTTAATATPCFVAFAAGNTGTRVAGDVVFAVDCNNTRNF